MRFKVANYSRLEIRLDTLHIYTRVRGLAASAGVWLRAIETEISAALCALLAREGLSFLAFYSRIRATCVGLGASHDGAAVGHRTRRFAWQRRPCPSPAAHHLDVVQKVMDAKDRQRQVPC